MAHFVSAPARGEESAPSSPTGLGGTARDEGGASYRPPSASISAAASTAGCSGLPDRGRLRWLRGRDPLEVCRHTPRSMCVLLQLVPGSVETAGPEPVHPLPPDGGVLRFVGCDEGEGRRRRAAGREGGLLDRLVVGPGNTDRRARSRALGCRGRNRVQAHHLLRAGRDGEPEPRTDWRRPRPFGDVRDRPELADPGREACDLCLRQRVRRLRHGGPMGKCSQSVLVVRRAEGVCRVSVLCEPTR